MLKMLEIVWNSFKMALQELKANKLRTFLSLFGITIGIFCIISVLATVNSLEANIQNEVKDLGNNTIYIDKWEYAGGGPDYPWWKYVKRPSPKYAEIEDIKSRVDLAGAVAFSLQSNGTLETGSSSLSGVNIYGTTEQYSQIQPLNVSDGRYLNTSDYDFGSPTAVIGSEVAINLYGSAPASLGKSISLKGKKMIIVGIIEKKGKSMIGGFDYDNSIIIPYRFMRQVFNEENAGPVIMVMGKPGISDLTLREELRGAMRAIRRLSPQEEDNFSLNAISDFQEAIGSLFASLNIGGWAIAVLSLVVGMFGVANIMFVTVRERTSQIGLKKAIGAKKSVILTEFLLESAFLCIIGGAIGLLLVFILTQIVSVAFEFPVTIPLNILILAITICILVGILAGIIPARMAAKMDPVVAIRSK